MKVTLTPNPEGLRRLRAIGDDVGQIARLDDPALLRALGTTHRKQELAIFASEGAAGGAGAWPALNPRYVIRKAKAVGSRKRILTLTGEMKDQFTRFGAPGYVQEFVPRGTLGIFRFGARSSVAAAHKTGNPSLATTPSATARKVFGGIAARLPVRDMITKSASQLEELRETLKTWFIARVKQGLRGEAALRGGR